MRIIDADALIEELTSGTRHIYEFVCLSQVLEKIDNAPTITPDMAQVLAYESGKASADRPTGEWIEGTQGFYCSKYDYYDKYFSSPRGVGQRMNRRTEGEIKAYVEGYTKCYNDFTEYLKGRRSVAEAIRKMDMLLTAVKAVVEPEDSNNETN